MSRQSLEKPNFSMLSFPPGLITVMVFSQLIQNAAARVQGKLTHHSSSQGSKLLPVCHRIEFKVFLLFYKYLNCLGPKYTMIVFYHMNHLSLSGHQVEGLLIVPRLQTKSGARHLVTIYHRAGTTFQRILNFRL